MRRYRQAQQEAVEGGPEQGWGSRGGAKRRRADKDAQDTDAGHQAPEEAAHEVDERRAVHVQQVP